MLSKRAAMLMPSPKISSSSMRTSPRLMPIPEQHATVNRHIGVPPRHEFLHRDGALYRGHNRGKLEQDAVTGGLDDAAAVVGNDWIDGSAMIPQSSRCS